MSLSAQLAASRSSHTAAERRAETLAKALATKSAAFSNKDCEVRAANRQTEEARTASQADRASADSAAADAEKLREQLSALSQLSSKVGRLAINWKHAFRISVP